MVTLNFQKYKIQQQVHIYACIYVSYTEKQYIEKQDALSAVSVKWSASQQWTGYFIKRTNEPKNKNL